MVALTYILIVAFTCVYAYGFTRPWRHWVYGLLALTFLIAILVLDLRYGIKDPGNHGMFHALIVAVIVAAFFTAGCVWKIQKDLDAHWEKLMDDLHKPD